MIEIILGIACGLLAIGGIVLALKVVELKESIIKLRIEDMGGLRSGVRAATKRIHQLRMDVDQLREDMHEH